MCMLHCKWCGLWVYEMLLYCISLQLWGLVFRCATSPCTLKINKLLWLQSYMLLKHQRNNLCKHENRIFWFTEIVGLGVSLCDITLYTQNQQIVMVTELHVTETPNGTISVNTKIGFSGLQRLWGLVFRCATSPCTLKINKLLWLQSCCKLEQANNCVDAVAAVVVLLCFLRKPMKC